MFGIPKKETNKGNQFNNPIKGCVFKSPPRKSRDVFFRGKIRQETIIKRLIKISDKFILSLSGFSFLEQRLKTIEIKRNIDPNKGAENNKNIPIKKQVSPKL